jgi:hypothetical protein
MMATALPDVARRWSANRLRRWAYKVALAKVMDFYGVLIVLAMCSSQ